MDTYFVVFPSGSKDSKSPYGLFTELRGCYLQLCSDKGEVIDEQRIGKDCEGSGRGLTEISSRHLPRGTKPRNPQL